MSNKVEIKRELLIKTALKMIEKEGIANFSVRKLTEACGCDRQAPYRMYGSKEGLVQELYTRILIALGNYVLKRARLRKQRGEEAYLVIIDTLLCKQSRVFLDFFNRGEYPRNRQICGKQ
ncbi:TetR/AcrR family transcriptional regulator [Christensenella hongkongensis]|uniref:TetR/AcrR family transcriptional regulator n=1 Tax=Christensenella hongkongensis TaxID=270498 RepID=UPI002671B4C5|nr:TetR family transcriptional regulator [Christensenella hongkongensis]